MLEIIVLSAIITIFGLIIYKEYQNTKRYNEERRRYKQNKQPIVSKTHAKKEKLPSKEKPKTEPQPSIVQPQEKLHEEKEIEKEVPKEIEEKIKTVDLPVCDYPPFDHSRTVAMGLSEEEAVEFVQELISQVETQIPLIEEQLQVPDFHKMERLTHSIKGSATNLGTGSVSDLLVAYNTYLKSGTDLQIATAYFECLKEVTQKLKEQYR